MLAFFKRSIYALSNKIRQTNSGYPTEKKLTIDFSNPVNAGKKSPFNIKSESSYTANLSNSSLELGLKKTNFIAWLDIPNKEYQDSIIDARIRLDNLGGYAAAGIIFRMIDDSSYYLALISSKGYFRLDAIKNNVPYPLIAWTEITNFDEMQTSFKQQSVANIKLKIITYGTYLIFIVNGKWIGEICDDSIIYGQIGFAAASYLQDTIADNNEQQCEQTPSEQITENGDYTCKAYLDFLSIDTRVKEIEECFKHWTNDSNINADGRLRLAETFAVMSETHIVSAQKIYAASAALDQLNKAWKRRDEVIRTVSAATSEVRTKKELIIAARMAFRLEQYNEAEEFIDTILYLWPDSQEGKLAITEKIRILNELNRFKDLKDFFIKYSAKIDKNIDYYTLIARCYWELKEYQNSAETWDKAYETNKEANPNLNIQAGVYASNAANAYELANNEKEALKHYIDAGNIFLNIDNKEELAVLIPKLNNLGSKNWEAHALIGKWAYSQEDYIKSAQEFAISNKLRCALKPRPKADAASYYLWALMLHLKGKNSEAIRLLERAIKLAPDYGLFRFKYAEIKLKCSTENSKKINYANEFKIALEHLDDPNGEMTEHAGNLLLSIGDAKNAKYFLDKVKMQQANSV
ncbi:MAG: hypothetical protein FWB86_07435 [Treponema sp.]|nr:hypothetical protein [Treponema sp.]MCL2252097.1 hypothetical protein [Treponema sp.]